jgi:hypothetical protein
LLLAVAACGGSASNAGPTTTVAPSTTTAEDARAIDGPVMRYQTTSSPSGTLATLLEGELQLDGDCLYFVQGAIEQRFPILWPADTRWDAQNEAVLSPTGAVMQPGSIISGRGGFFYLSDVNLLAGTAALNLATRCVDNDYQQTAVFKNDGAAVGPKTN